MWIDDLENTIDKKRISTHWEDCYLEHKDCAILRLIAVARAANGVVSALEDALSDLRFVEQAGGPGTNFRATILRGGHYLAAFREAEGG